MENKPSQQIKPENILIMFELVEASIRRAKLPFEVGTYHAPQIQEVTLWECLKARERLYTIIQEIGHPALPKTYISYGTLERSDMRLICEYCGDPNCDSEHK